MGCGGSVVKTRMQALGARAQYRNAAQCAYRIFVDEGVRRFWTGTTPRLARLIVRARAPPCGMLLMLPQLSGGITFTVYEQVVGALGARDVAKGVST
jgi:solute carrier family 25 citrate transporter 1